MATSAGPPPDAQHRHDSCRDRPPLGPSRQRPAPIPNTQSLPTTIAYQGRLADSALCSPAPLHLCPSAPLLPCTSAPLLPCTSASVHRKWLGITVGTDDEMQPRVQLGSVPWAVQALTVPETQTLCR